MIVPNQTLYVNNLADNFTRDEMKKILYLLFTQYGRIIDVIVVKSKKMRGQAHVVFQDLPEATSALRALQGFPLCSKPIRIAYGKGKSQAVKRMEGEAGDFDAVELVASGKRALEQLESEKSSSKKLKSGDKAEVDEEEMDVEEGGEAPSRVLFIQELSPDISAEMLTLLFQQYHGFVQVRMVPSKHDLAFVEFEGEQDAMRARFALDGFQLTSTTLLKISFSKQ